MKIAATLLLIVSLLVSSCVQKTHRKTVVFRLDTSGIKAIKKVGLRGGNKPLSWAYDTEMKTVKKDSLYEITSTFETGYAFAEVKFVVNDIFELQDKENRRIVFSKKDTTFYAAKFDKN